MLAMMTPIGDAWAAPTPASKAALARASSTKIPFVDYDGEAADVDHYCRSYGVMCEKAKPPKKAPEAFEGMTEDEINDVFVAAGRPQVDASFHRSPPAGADDAPASADDAPAPEEAPPPHRRRPAPRDRGDRDDRDDPWAWVRQMLRTDDFYNLALFALAGLLLIVVLDQMVRVGIEISRARIGMAVALRNAAQVTSEI